MSDDRVIVLRIIDRLNVGGPAIHVALASKHLDPLRFRTVLVTGNVEPEEADMSYLLDELGVECIRLPSLGRELRPIRDLATAWELFRIVRDLRPDVVHTHKAKAGALGRVVALLARVPVRIHTYHGHVFSGYFGPAKTQLYLFIERLLARISTRLIALSDGLVGELSEKYRIGLPERYSVVPLGFDLTPFATCERFRGELRAKVKVATSVRLVGIVGRMVPVKDHRTFVAAASQLAARRDDVHFVFIGSGELESEVRAELEACGLATRAHLLGWQRELAPIYADLDVVTLSSINEGTPVALVEAMASGVPIVSTAVGGVPDLLAQGRRGVLVPPRDPTALAAGIESALSEGARQRASAVRAEIVAQFGVERLCADLARLYLELLRDKEERP